MFRNGGLWTAWWCTFRTLADIQSVTNKINSELQEVKGLVNFYSRLVIYHPLQIISIISETILKFLIETNFAAILFLQPCDILEYFIHIDTITTIQVTKVTE